MSISSQTTTATRTQPSRASKPKPGQLEESEMYDDTDDRVEKKKKKRKSNEDEKKDEDWEDLDQLVDDDSEEEEEDRKHEMRQRKKKKKKVEDEAKEEEEEEEYEEQVAPPIIDGNLPAPPASWYRARTIIDLVSDSELDDDIDSWDAAYGEFLAEEAARQHEYFLGDRNYID